MYTHTHTHTHSASANTEPSSKENRAYARGGPAKRTEDSDNTDKGSSKSNKSRHWCYCAPGTVLSGLHAVIPHKKPMRYVSLLSPFYSEKTEAHSG